MDDNDAGLSLQQPVFMVASKCYGLFRKLRVTGSVYCWMLWRLMSVPELRRLVAGFPPRRTGFDPKTDHARIVVNKAALGQVYSESFGFPCQFSVYQMLHTRLSSAAGTICQLVADIPNGLSLTPPQGTMLNNYHWISMEWEEAAVA
jgi:hypothetical protein